ncbi:hypothetical protein AB0G60_01215 [Streptomyces angustmyceticus]|uniref:Lipoprotein n=1 Tax=Streptomyces angustmyceticus TaxID=285578 RepID=A0A5J4L8M9_9ACTN|nr:hypothetical protein [Streptomyces angustmyceticus]UAL65307.1 hypothetical protein K7396_01210 [Streptomyces angustmyceticus]GES28211.1 hypothetical protein San01_06980 [Streptomyces angustmyceticus]
MSDRLTHHRGRKTAAATLIAAAALALTAACQHSASGAAESRSGASAATVDAPVMNASAANAPVAHAPVVNAPVVRAADTDAARVITVVAGRGAYSGSASAAQAETIRLLPSAGGGQDEKIEPGMVHVIPRDGKRNSRL